LSSVYLRQKNKNQLTLNKVYSYLTLFSGSRSITSTIFCTSAKEEPSPDHPGAVFKVGKNYPETSPVIPSWGSEREPNVNLSASNVLIQHSFEISHLVAVLRSIQGAAAKDRPTASAVPSDVTHISAGERLRVERLKKHTLSSSIGPPDKPTNQRSTETPPRVLDQNSVSQLSSLGPCAEALGWIDKSINGVKRKDERESDD